MTDPQYLAQVGHFFGAYALIFTVGVFTRMAVLLLVFAGGILLAALKEFWFDIHYEKDSWKNSAMDFAFYVVGGIVGLGVEVLRTLLSSGG